MNLRNKTLGDSVLVVTVYGSNAWRYIDEKDKSSWIFEGKIAKKGKKYIYVDFKKEKGVQFNIKDGYSTYSTGSSNYVLYESEKSFEDELEKKRLCDKLKNKFTNNNCDCSLEVLKKIEKLLEKDHGQVK